MFSKLIKWSLSEYRSLPWRKNRTRYKTLVSEIMLQQTTVSTVMSKFDGFIEEFPNMEALAKASEEELQIAWKGLGYYRRARNLKKACEYFCRNFNAKIPTKREQLLDAPGIGEYTASSLIAIGMNKPEIAIDANIERVMARLYGLEHTKRLQLHRAIREIYFTDKTLQKYLPREFNEALMDLGRVYCQARKVECALCPMNKVCVSKGANALKLPAIKKAEKKPFYELLLLRVIVIKNNKILCYRKQGSEWLSGQYEIPTFTINTQDTSLAQYPILVNKLMFAKLPMIKTSITQYKISNYILELSPKEFEKAFGNKYEWRELNSQSNLSTASMKCLKKINRDEG